MRFLAFAMVLVLLAGCSMATGNTVAMRNRMPEIEKPARPKTEKMTPEELQAYLALPEALRKKLEGNNDKVQVYAEQLEVGVNEYNGYAKYNNKLMKEAIGIKTEEPKK